MTEKIVLNNEIIILDNVSWVVLEHTEVVGYSKASCVLVCFVDGSKKTYHGHPALDIRDYFKLQN